MTLEYRITNENENFRKMCEKASDENQIVKIIIDGKKAVYVISEDEFASLEETAHLFRHSANRTNLQQALTSNESVKFDSIEDLRRETRL